MYYKELRFNRTPTVVKPQVKISVFGIIIARSNSQKRKDTNWLNKK